MFEQIALKHWRQFEEIDIKFHPRMTVLTGSNGSGKTTILNTLSRHFGWNIQLVSTPLSKSLRRLQTEWPDIWSESLPESSPPPGAIEVGKIKYVGGGESSLMAPPHPNQPQYTLNFSPPRNVPGIHIPSHRPEFAYRRISAIPVDPKTSQQQYQEYQNLLQQFYVSDHSPNPAISLKQSLIALAVFGYGNEAVAENPEYKRMFQEFQDVLRFLLPKNLGFTRLEIRMPEIVFITESGDFSLDAASGGIGALIGIAWQVFMYSQAKTEFVVTIDEPETHLHPSMQRELLPNLFRAFPRAQFIVATHSPFVVTSAPEAHVYVLTYNESQRVKSCLLEQAELSGTANEVLREILGVSMTVPIWVEQSFEDVLNKYKAEPLETEALRRLKADLIARGLIGYLPEAISRIEVKHA